MKIIKVFMLTLIFLSTSSIQASSLSVNSIEKKQSTIKDKHEKLTYLLSVEQYISSLNKPEQARYRFLLGMAYEGTKQLDLSIQTFTQSIELAKHNKNKAQLVESLIERSYSKYLKTYDTLDYCEDRKNAHEASALINNIDLKIRALVQYAFCFKNKKEQFSEALALLDKALELATKNQLSPNTKAMIYNALGIIYQGNQLHEKAYQYLLSAYEQWAQVNDFQDMFNMQYTLVNSAIENLAFDTALQHVDAMFLLAKEQPQFEDFTFFSLYSAALVRKNQNKLKQSIPYYVKALEKQNDTKEKYFVRYAYENLAVVYFRTNEYNKAVLTFKAYKRHFPKAKYITDEIKVIELYDLGDQKETMKALFDVAENQITKRREFTYFAAQATANLHGDKITVLDQQVLQQNIKIKALRSKNIEEEKQFTFYLTLLFSVLIFSLLLFITYLLNIQKHFKRHARTDGLTGIANRRFILQQGKQLLYHATAQKKPLSILVFDIDNFKQINDGQGHYEGDRAIKLIVKSVETCLRKVDIIGRIGGDEFLLILPETNVDEAKIIAERIRNTVDQSAQKAFIGFNFKEKVSISIGVVSARSVDDLQSMIIRADDALYQAKDFGRNTVVIGE